MRLSFLSILAVLSFAVSPALAGNFQAANRNMVNALPGGAFEVIGRPGDGGPQFWCAAGDYAVRVLGAQATDRIYITRGRGAPETGEGRASVQFSMTPPAGATPGQSSLFLKMKDVGDNLSAAFAQGYCHQEWEIN